MANYEPSHLELQRNICYGYLSAPSEHIPNKINILANYILNILRLLTSWLKKYFWICTKQLQNQILNFKLNLNMQ